MTGSSGGAERILYKKFDSGIGYHGQFTAKARLAKTANAWSRSAGMMQSLTAFMFIPHTHLCPRPGPFTLTSENTPLTSLY